jgi:putative ABC transport system permease protein
MKDKLAEFWRRLLFLLRRQQFEADLEEEMRFHLERKAADTSPGRARRQFGNTTLLLEDSREVWGWRWLDTLVSDLPFALRLLRHNPGFSTVAILTLGLAIGGNTLVFSLVNAVVLRPLPYSEPDRLVYLWTVEASSQRGMNTSYPDFRDWQEQSHTFEAMSAFAQGSSNLSGAGEPERIDSLRFTPGLLELLGIRPALGRTFGRDDDTHVVLLGSALWRRHFGADPAVIGRSIHLDGVAYTVLGICPPGFHFPPNRFSGDPEVFLPLLPNPDRTAWFLRVIGRLRPGATIQQARAEIDAIGKRLAESYPVERRAQGIRLDDFSENVIGNSRKTARLLLGAVAFVLLIACANVANLLLSQGTARGREIAIRAAIGASRRRIVRQLLVESALLGICGGLAGVAVAWLGLPALAAVVPERSIFFTRIRDAGVQLDSKVLSFTAATSLLAGMLFGVLPALRTTRPAATMARRTISGTLRGALVATEVSLALILLAGAGLMINSMLRLLSVDLGFRAERLLTLQMDLPRVKYPNGPGVPAFFDDVLQRLRALPGAVSAGAASDLPLTRALSTGRIRIEGSQPVEGRAAFHSVSPGYFETMGIPLVRGRAFSAADTEQAPQVVIVNRRLAEQYWPHDDPVGKVVAVYGLRQGRRVADPLTVVGVVGDVRLIALDATPGSEIYMPHTQRQQSGMAIVLRTAGRPELLADAVRKEVWRADADQPITDLKPMEMWIATDVSFRRFVLLLIGIFAAVALILAAIGIFGVVSYAVKQRTQEIGIRMALGARPSDVAAVVFRETAIWLLLGLTAGTAGAVALTQLLAAYLYEVRPVDIPTFAVASLTLAAIAASANMVPVRRAMRIDPVVTLRYE